MLDIFLMTIVIISIITIVVSVFAPVFYSKIDGIEQLCRYTLGIGIFMAFIPAMVSAGMEEDTEPAEHSGVVTSIEKRQFSKSYRINDQYEAEHSDVWGVKVGDYVKYTDESGGNITAVMEE